MHMHSTIKKFKIIQFKLNFFEKMFKLYMILACTFFKLYISKICNDFPYYIYIYIYMIQNSLATKIKNLDEHVVQNWISIQNLIKFGLFNFTLNNSLGIKLKSKWDTWHKIENLIKT